MAGLLYMWIACIQYTCIYNWIACFLGDQIRRFSWDVFCLPTSESWRKKTKTTHRHWGASGRSTSCCFAFSCGVGLPLLLMMMMLLLLLLLLLSIVVVVVDVIVACNCVGLLNALCWGSSCWISLDRLCGKRGVCVSLEKRHGFEN